MQFHRGTVGCFGEPDVKVLALARLEEEHVVAVVEIGELVELVELRLRVEFGIFSAVGEEAVEIIEEVSVSTGQFR